MDGEIDMFDSRGDCGREDDVSSLGLVSPEVVVYGYVDGLRRGTIEERNSLGADLVVERE